MKKKNDFDFIENKLNASLNAPESVNKDFVLNTLEGSETKEKSNIIPLKKKRQFKALPTIAAAVAVVLIAALGFGVVPNIPKNNVLSAEQTSEPKEMLTAYSSYADIKKDIRSLNKTKFDLFGVLGFQPKYEYVLSNETDSAAAADGTAKTASGESFGQTFTQVAGVDEDDTIKTDGKYIYYIAHDYGENVVTYDDVAAMEEDIADGSDLVVYIFEAAGKQSKLLTSVPVECQKDFPEIGGIYVSGDRLCVITTADDETQTALYNISDIDHVRQTAQFSQSGDFSASRLIGEKLFIVSCEYEEEIPYICCGDETQKIPANRIYKTSKPNNSDFLVVTQIDLHGENKIEQAKAVLGGSNNIYCNEEHMYVLCDISWSEANNSFHSQSELFKIDIANGIHFTAAAKLNGYAKNQYAMDEYKGVFRIAVTDYTADGENVNRLYTLDENLKQLGEVRDFARGEHIEAVRFFGDTAYVITYETTDPLFVVDLSDAANPYILGEVKIDGFSTTLVPVGENKILGLGTDADNTGAGMNSLKLALFDITDKTAPKVVDEKVYKNITTNAMMETKEILRNPTKNNFTVYISEYTNITERTDEAGYVYDYDFDTQYGALTFAVKGDNILTENKFISHKTDSPTGRCTFIGDTIYLVDEYANIDCTEY